MSFKKLNLNRSLISDTIEQFVGSNTNVSITTVKEGFHIYKFTQTGINPGSLNIYYNADGSTTLQPLTGKNQEWSTTISEEIKNKCSVKEFKSNSFYLKAIRKEDLEVVIDFLIEEQCATILEDKEITNGRNIKLQGTQGDKMTINHFKNEAFQVQGKPRMLFHDTIMILSELLPFKDIIDTQLQYYETNLTSGDVLSEIENRLPLSHNLIDDKIKSVISPSLALLRTDLALTDYSAFAFPILRGIEGVMKQIFASKSVLVSKEGFGPLFDNRGISINFTQESRNKIQCSKHERALCNLYSFYNSQRHALFHMDGTVSTSRIIDRQTAINIINTGINVIEDSFSIITS